MTLKQHKYSIKTLLSTALLSTLMFSANVQAAWYTVKITTLTPRSATGEVFVKFVPGTGEDRFSGTARCLIADDVGANRVLSVILTAVSLDTDVVLDLPEVPTNTPQVVNGIGMTAPSAQ